MAGTKSASCGPVPVSIHLRRHARRRTTPCSRPGPDTPRPRTNMSYYLVEPWGRDKYRQATVLFTATTTLAVYAQCERLVARLIEQGIDPATFEWHVVDDDRKPVARPGAH